MTTPILKNWTRSDSEKKSQGLTLAVKRLRSRADGYMVDAAQAKLDAEAALEKALAKAEKNPDFGAIVNAPLAVKKAELTYAKATEVYTESFGAAPTV